MKLKQIAAAAALAVAAASPALASISLPDTGNGELFLVVWDGTDQVSYVRDLGIFMDSFSTTTSQSFALDDAFFTAFLGIADNTNTAFDDLRFAVIAGDSVGGTSRRLFTTVDNAVTELRNSGLTSSVNWLNTFANNQVQTSANTTHAGPAAVNGTSYDIVGNQAYFLTQSGPVFNNSLAGAPWTNSPFVNTDAIFRGFASNGLPGGNFTNQTTFDGVWRVSATGGAWQATYTVTPIPEADGIAMMLAGIGALGWVVRRRRPV